MPSWHGTPANLAEEFVAFMRNGSQQRTDSLIHSLQTDIEDAEDLLRENVEVIRAYHSTIKGVRETLTKLRTSLASFDDLSRFDDGLIELLYHPFVVGIRPDSGGRLVIHLRLFKEFEEGSPVHLGDYEINLITTQEGLSAYENLQVASTSTTDGSQYAFQHGGTSHGVTYGILRLPRGTVRRHVLNGTFSSLIDDIAATLVRNGSPWPTDDKPLPDPVWSGIASNLEGMLARTVEVAAIQSIRKEIAEREKTLHSYEEYSQQATNIVRKTGRKLVALRSELEAVQKLHSEQSFDEGNARAQLHYMTSLDGVMGVKFLNVNGEQIPVFHVRASIVHNEKRYDLGDYEVTLIEYNEHQGGVAVVRVHQTREPSRYSSGFYYHPEGDGYERHDWFCFGTQADELRQLFRKGEFAEFMHLVVNSLGGINTGSRERIPHYFNEIPMDATWTGPVNTVRSRPRRRLGRAVLSLIT
jgi:hypothetical protein